MADNQSAELEKWLKGRPQVVKDIARKYPPWNDYELKGHEGLGIYNIYSISEDGTVTCNKVDWLGIPTQVFGMNPEDLVEVTDLVSTSPRDTTGTSKKSKELKS